MIITVAIRLQGQQCCQCKVFSSIAVILCVCGGIKEGEGFPSIGSLHICNNLVIDFINILNTRNDYSDTVV